MGPCLVSHAARLAQGFGAPAISSTYDAQLFATVALLSSHTLYTSIRLITQTELDALELLAHRALLFIREDATARAESGRSSSTGQRRGNEAALRLPALTWVIGDFVQRHKEGETASMWLERLLRGARADGQKHPGLDAVFNSVRCATLWVPSSSSVVGEGLEALPRESWSKRFENDMNDLEAAVRQALAALDMPQWFGGEYVSLLTAVAEAARSGSFRAIKSNWELYSGQFSAAAARSCISDVRLLLAPNFGVNSHGNVNCSRDVSICAASDVCLTSADPFAEALTDLSYGMPPTKKSVRTAVDAILEGARAKFTKLVTNLPVDAAANSDFASSLSEVRCQCACCCSRCMHCNGLTNCSMCVD